jgi:hypothetical protein
MLLSTPNLHITDTINKYMYNQGSEMSSIWLTNSALVYEPKCLGGGVGYGVSANEYSCAHGA